MHIKQVGKNLYQVELCTGGIEHLICSYIITGAKPMLVETGPANSIPNLLCAIDVLGIDRNAIRYVAISHVHLDHGGGAGTLLKETPNAKVIVHPRGAPHLINPDRLWPSSQSVLGFVSEVFGKPEAVPQDRVVPITEGTIELDGGKLTIIETVGHASHHLSFQESFNGGVFTGDAAGTYLAACDVIVPTIPPPFFLEPALTSLDKLIALNPTALYFTHFGKADDAVNRLRAYKEQLKLWARVAEEGVKANLSFEEIRANIIKADPVMTQVAPYIREHKIYQKTVLENCIHGIIGYAKQKVASS